MLSSLVVLTSIVAHPGSPHDASWLTIEPEVTLGIALLTALYLYAVGPLRRKYGWADKVDRRYVTNFLLAMLTLFVALQGPIHELSDYYLLSAHMVQHLLITLVMPPLLLKSIPEWLMRPILQLPFVMPVAKFLFSPLVAFAFFNIVLAFWHVPAFYELTLRDHWFHVLEHLLFMVTAVITWWPVYSPTPLLPRLSDPLQILYLFSQSIPMTVIGALITFADMVLYSWYKEAPRIINNLSVMDDQQIAGLIMWIGGTSIVLFVLTIRFFQWFAEDADENLETSEVS
jgi:putative membrane protein